MSKMEIVKREVERAEAEGRRVIVVCGSNARALSALAGTGSLVTVSVDEVELVEESRDWSDWKDEEGCRSEAMEEFNYCLQVYSEGKDVSDAKRRKAWQTCYGPATRKGKRDKHDFKGRGGRNRI